MLTLYQGYHTNAEQGALNTYVLTHLSNSFECLGYNMMMFSCFLWPCCKYVICVTETLPL